MPEILYGRWKVEASQREPFFGLLAQRFTISGSQASDGVYNGHPFLNHPEFGQHYPSLNVASTNGWTLTIEWASRAHGLEWSPPELRRHATYELKDGLVVVLFAVHDGMDFDEYVQRGGLVITCTNLDPDLNPLSTPGCPYDFTFADGEVDLVNPPPS